jgi:ATP-dependent Lon protease
MKPSVFNPSYCTITLDGLSRVRLQTPYPPASKLSSLPLHPVDYPPQSKSSLSEPAGETFRACALKLLERLDMSAKSKGSGGNRVDWRRMKVVVEEAEVDRLPWVAGMPLSLSATPFPHPALSDILVAVTPSISWSDRLTLLAAYRPDERLRLASTSFTKHISITEVSQKINSAVDESLSKQQKEYYLRQQLHAIQKELASLHKSGKKDETGADNRESGSELDEDGGDEDAFMAELKEKIENMEKNSEERRMAAREYQRLKRIPATSVEHGVIRTYVSPLNQPLSHCSWCLFPSQLEWLTSLPWPNTVKDQNRSIETLKDSNFLSRAREQLEADHFGLEMIKKRLIEHMAVIRLKALNALAEQGKDVHRPQQMVGSVDAGTIFAISKALPQGVDSPIDAGAAQHIPTVKKPKVIKTKGPILLLVGPPGCGKTSIAASLAKALDRPFQRISLGGVRDEAEIRGHRRTYVASGPGAIVSALSKAKRLDPVILLWVLPLR